MENKMNNLLCVINLLEKELNDVKFKIIDSKYNKDNTMLTVTILLNPNTPNEKSEERSYLTEQLVFVENEGE